MNKDIIYKILRETCAQLRKGEAVVESQSGGIAVTEIYDMPADDGQPTEGYQKVDVHFITILVNVEAAERNRAALIEQLDAWPDKEMLASGPSYIAVGGVIGDQGAAFMLFALGEVLGIWKVITPAKLGMKGDEGDRMAGLGYIMCSGYKPKQN